MKIIREGNKIIEVWRGTCMRCGCVFELEGDEPKTLVDCACDNTLFTKCPNCDGGVNVRKVNAAEDESGDT